MSTKFSTFLISWFLKGTSVRKQKNSGLCFKEVVKFIIRINKLEESQTIKAKSVDSMYHRCLYSKGNKYFFGTCQ